MKISIITVVFNNAKTINIAIDSVLSQTYKNVEYIIIDGGSTDGTVEIVKSYKEKINYFLSEKDQGIYDAMNKGIKIATGEIIGILNSDDRYCNKYVLEDIIYTFSKGKDYDCVYGNLLYLKNDKPYRYWKGGKPRTFKYGWMPPHPTFL